MTVFKHYARYYDLLYKDKDYKNETDYLIRLLKKNNPSGTTVLELGCGTGRHASMLAEQGFTVHGVDISEDMLAEANKRRDSLPAQVAERLSFSGGDVRTLDLKKNFDIVISIFHVVSYQTSNQDLERMFSTVRKHLQSGGLFVFDCWYGPAVLTQRPEVRVRRLEDEVIEVTRIAVPEINPNLNTVDVKYHLFVRDKISRSMDEIDETHKMRYLFVPEVEKLFTENNMTITFMHEWMTEEMPDFNSWSVCFGGTVNER